MFSVLLFDCVVGLSVKRQFSVVGVLLSYTSDVDNHGLPLHLILYVQGGPKNGPFLRVDNFATVSGREACNMSKVGKFYLEICVELACQCV